jgi:protein-serine/threonine kinase
LRDDGGQVLLSDFGFSAHFEDDKRLETACGSPCYAAPELVLDKSGYIGPPVDLWSCGVIMYAMAFGYLPFESDLKLDRHGSDPVTWTPTNVYHLYQYIVANPVKLPKSSLSDSGRDLLLRLLDADPVMRITLAEALQHPWLAS